MQARAFSQFYGIIGLFLSFLLRANLGESLSEARQEHEKQIKKLQEELENETHQIKKAQRENEHKQYEIESLKFQLRTVEQNFEASREHMKELGDRCCVLIEQETENQVSCVQHDFITIITMQT